MIRERTQQMSRRDKKGLTRISYRMSDWKENKETGTKVSQPLCERKRSNSNHSQKIKVPTSGTEIKTKTKCAPAPPEWLRWKRLVVTSTGTQGIAAGRCANWYKSFGKLTIYPQAEHTHDLGLSNSTPRCLPDRNAHHLVTKRHSC